MDSTALLISLAFVGIAVLLSLKERLQLERDILVATARAFGQLLAIGYVLQFIFDLDNWPAMLAMLAVMVSVAGYNAGKRGKGLPRITAYVTGTIAVSETITLILLLVLGVIDASPRFVIPVSGMVIGNSMVVSGLVLNRLKAEVQQQKLQVQAALSLGATSRQAVVPMLQQSVKAGMIPTIDAMKTMGLVQLPGMMTGAIIAGESPVVAVRYQIIIMFTLTAAVSLTAIFLSMAVYRLFFTSAHQLREITQ